LLWASCALRVAREKLCEEAGRLLFLVARAPVCRRHIAHDLINVLTAAAPSGFSAGSAGDCVAHGGSPSVVVVVVVVVVV
jgi:hypothetical protein